MSPIKGANIKQPQPVYVRAFAGQRANQESPDVFYSNRNEPHDHRRSRWLVPRPARSPPGSLVERDDVDQRGAAPTPRDSGFVDVPHSPGRPSIATFEAVNYRIAPVVENHPRFIPSSQSGSAGPRNTSIVSRQ